MIKKVKSNLRDFANKSFVDRLVSKPFKDKRLQTMKTAAEKPLSELLSKHKISESEYELIINLIGHKPNEIELAMFGVMWSEHCAYKNSKPLLKQFPAKSSRTKILAGQGENAGIIDCGDGLKVAFKIESHNRPTAIEPFQGATTGVGGILRDILTLGARPIAFLNSLHFGLPSDEHSYYLLTNAINGIAHYGNCTGIPTVGGQLICDESYAFNPLVNAMCIGILETENPIPSSAAGIGNPILYIGSETGRDGLGGAAFASSGLNNKSSQNRPAVQVGDPFIGKLLIEACLEAFKTGFVVASQDMGAAGLTCACCEMSAKGEVGINLDLSRVPTRGKLEPFEYLLSESQERMLMIAEKGREQALIEIFEKWNLPAVVVGEVTSNGFVQIFYEGQQIVKLPPKALTDQAPIYKRQSVKPKKQINILSEPDLACHKNEIERKLLDKLSSPNGCSRNWIYKQFDQQVQLNTLFRPGSADAALLKLSKNSLKGLAITLDCNPFYVKVNPYLGAQIAVAEAARNIASVGAQALAITDNLNFGNPEDPEAFYYLEESVKGIIEACNQLDLPVVSGNVSLYNQFLKPDGSSKGEILPTPVIGMIGLIENYHNALQIAFKEEKDSIWLIGDTFNENDCPKLDWNKEKALHEFLQENAQSGLLRSCHDLSEGGLLVALAECILASDLGAQIELEKPENLKLYSLLFGESQSRAIVTTDFQTELKTKGNLKIYKIGKVVSQKELKVSFKEEQKEIINLSKEFLEENNFINL